ncbi:MAG TPA: hypothetical protein VFU05_02480 [Cyclobacteriaceae bacterium]|nr:hypothetical protein [Cyclobacteriaceae bacterium]
MKNTQYITNKKGKKISVVLPIREYEKMLSELDELSDIKAYDKAKSGKLKFMAAEEAFAYLKTKRKK